MSPPQLEEEGSLNALDALGINPPFLLSQIVNFCILLILLRLLLYKPALKAIEQRRATLEKGFQDSEAAQKALANAEAEKQRILEEARAEANKLRAEATQQAAQAAAKIKADAQAEAERIKAEAQAVLAAERDKMLSELRGQIASLAIAAANKLIGESLDRQRQEALIADFFARVPAHVRSQLSGQPEAAQVLSAVPLTPEEQARIKDELACAAVEFRVDPRLLGGLQVRIGDRVLDGSVAGQLEALRTSLS